MSNLGNLSAADLTTILTQIDAKMEDLLLIKQGIELNQQAITLTAKRLDLQHTLLQKMLSEMQGLLLNLQTVARQRGNGLPVH